MCCFKYLKKMVLVFHYKILILYIHTLINLSKEIISYNLWGMSKILENRRTESNPTRRTDKISEYVLDFYIWRIRFENQIDIQNTIIYLKTLIIFKFDINQLSNITITNSKVSISFRSNTKTNQNILKFLVIFVKI